MWGKAHVATQDRMDHLTEEDLHDPFAELRPAEPIRRRRPKPERHEGSVHQVVYEAAPALENEPEPEPTRNAKYADAPRVNLAVARRMVAMVIALTMFGAASGGITVAIDLAGIVG